MDVCSSTSFYFIQWAMPKSTQFFHISCNGDLKKPIVKSGANKWINNKVEQVDILKTISVLMPLKNYCLAFLAMDTYFDIFDPLFHLVLPLCT